MYFRSLAKHNEPMPVGLIALDRVHSSEWSMALTLIKEWLFGSKKQKYVEEITLDTHEGAFARC